MPDNIDSLQIKISANAQSAERSLDRLADTLIRLQSSLRGISNGQFQNLSAGIRQLSDSMQRFSGAVKTADFTRIATGLNKLSAVNVQGVSDASRAIGTLTANLSQIGTIAFDSQGIANVANAIAQLGRKTVTQATANIPILTTALSGLVTGLNQIGSVQFDITGLSELTSSITKLGGKSATTAASGNITKLATALKQMMMTLSTAPRVSQNLIQMTQALAQLSSAGVRAGTATNSLVRNFNLLPASTAKARSGFNGLAGAIGKFYATYWLLIRGMGQFKKAIDISSDLTEVQNVVDVAFGDMSDKMNEFADSALELYGMSELTAKQIGSRFQAMGVSMGFAQKNMTDMSIRLTQLAGDLASFYNITQDEAATKLQSIFTGESEPLRSLGIDLAQTSVEAWALSQGIDADMRSMTNAEKTMLRYQYVLASTGQATNDFIRTQNSWANQLRLLTGAFEQLGSIVGGVLINAFKPFIQALNSVMGAVINFAQVVSDALGAIFGWEYQTGGGVAQDLELGAGSAEDIEDATGGAADNAKKLNKYIAAWHEVNNMTSNEGSKGSGGGGGAGGSGGAGAADGGQWVQAESLWERYTSSIDSLYALGDYIGKVLTDAMNSIDWDSVYESARNFGAGLASFLNGLISPELFGAVGTTIAGALNTVLHGLDSFGQTFDWINFGESIAAGINNFFSTFDFGLLANTLNVWANGLLDALIAALDNIEWEEIGNQIGTFLEGINLFEIGGKIAQAIWKAINAGFDLYKGMFETAPLETALLSLVGITKLLKADKVTKFISALSKGITVATNFGKALAGSKTGLDTLYQLAPKTAKVVDTLRTSFSAFVYYGKSGQWSKGFLVGIQNITKNLTGVQKGVITAASAFTEFKLVSSSVTDLITDTGSLAGNLAELASGAAIGAAGMYVALGPTGLAIAAITGIISAFKGVDDAMQEIAESSAIGRFSEAVNELSENVSRKSDEIKSNLENARDEIELAGAASANAARDLAGEYMELRDKTQLTADEQQRLKNISSELSGLVPGLSAYIDEQTGYLQVQDETLDSLIENMELYAKKQATQELLTEGYKQQAEATLNLQKANEGYVEAAQEFIDSNDGMSESVKNMIKEGDIQGLRDLKTQLWDVEQSHSKLEEAFGESAVNGRAVSEMIDLLEESTSGWASAISDAESAQEDANKTISYAKGDLEAYNEQLRLNEEQQIADTKATNEYKQAVSDLNTEFDRMNLNLSDQFAEDLALDDTGMVDSIVSAFEKMTSQVQLSASELQNLFADIAPGMSEDFINSLSEQEPNMQAQISMSIANMMAGAEMSAEEAKQIFATIGVELPNALIEQFTAQEPYMQTSAINLLSKLSSGYELTRGSLVELFSSLGIELPTTLITSLEGQEADVQLQAVELLGKIAEASNSEKGPLIEEFLNLGLDIDQSLIDGLTDGTLIEKIKEAGAKAPKTAKEGADSASKDSSGNSIFKEIGKFSLQGFIDGLSDNALLNKIGNAAANIFNRARDSIEKAGEIGSPSRVTRELGQFTLQGFNLGLEDEMDTTYSLVDSWANNVFRNFGGVAPSLDLSVDTSKYQFNPMSVNTGKLQSEMQQSLDYMFGASGGIIDYNRLGEAVYQAQSQAMQENPVQIGDDDVFRSAQRAQTRYQKRTNRIGWAGI